MTQPINRLYQLLHSSAENFSHETLSTRVASLLRQAIYDGILPPGTALIEQTIAEDLEISRAPVREAIRTLAEERLVESIPYKGARVYRLTPADVTEVYSMRGLLEGFAVREILETPVEPPLSVLRDICDEMSLAADKGDMKVLNAADEKFHRAIIEQADHALLLEMWTLIGIRARHIMGLRNAQLADPHQLVANHLEMVDALEANDSRLAVKLIEQHVEAGAQLLLDDWNDIDKVA